MILLIEVADQRSGYLSSDLMLIIAWRELIEEQCVHFFSLFVEKLLMRVIAFVRWMWWNGRIVRSTSRRRRWREFMKKKQKELVLLRKVTLTATNCRIGKARENWQSVHPKWFQNRTENLRWKGRRFCRYWRSENEMAFTVVRWSSEMAASVDF